MPLLSVMRNTIQPSGATRYDRLIRYIAERARQDPASPKWTAHLANGSDGRTVSFAVVAEGWAELASREQPEAMVRRLFGEGDGNALLEALGQAVQDSRFGISQLREDLSSPAVAQEGGAPAMALVTRLQVARGAGLDCEQFLRKCFEAAAKETPEALHSVWQAAVGDLSTLVVIRPVADPAELDGQPQLPELLAKVYGASDAEKILREGTAAIEEAETSLSTLLPELSNPAA